MILLKIHKAEGRQVAALCDESLFGKCYTEEKKQLDLTSDFFKGEPIEDFDQLRDILPHCTSVFAVGGETIDLLISLGMLEEKEVKTIAKIPYAEIVFA